EQSAAERPGDDERGAGKLEEGEERMALAVVDAFRQLGILVAHQRAAARAVPYASTSTARVLPGCRPGPAKVCSFTLTIIPAPARRASAFIRSTASRRARSRSDS